jgi:hypothetical protein
MPARECRVKLALVRSRTPALIVVLVVGALFTLTCGGVAACLGLIAHWQDEAVLEEPDAIRAAGQTIADLDIPPELAPVSGIRMNVPFTDRPLVYMTMYEGTDPLRYLMLFAIRRDAITDTSALQEQIERTLETATRPSTGEMVVDREWTDTVDVHGAPAAFRFRHSTNAAGNAEITEASGMFDGTFGPTTVVFVSMGPFDEEGFRAIFK